MQTLDLDQAANFLKMNGEVLRRKAHLGEIPGKKPGKRWIFVEEHLADWISGRYPEPRRDPAPVNEAELQVIDNKQQETTLCQSTNAKRRGGYNTPHQTVDAYNTLLELK